MPKNGSKTVCRNGAACTFMPCHFAHPDGRLPPPQGHNSSTFEDNSESMQLQRALMNKFEQEHASRLAELKRVKEAADAEATRLFMSKFVPGP